MERLIDPPREVPPGLRLKLLADGLAATAIWFVPAAVTLLAAFKPPGAPVKVGLFVLGSIFLAFGLQALLPSLWRTMMTLRRLRVGFVTMGRITTCRFAWDKRRADMPYPEFLADWTVNMARSQMNKASGCLAALSVIFFVVPLVLTALVLAVALTIHYFQLPGGDAASADFDAPYFARFAAMAVGSIVAILAMLKLLWWGTAKEVVPYLEWRRLAQPGEHDWYDAQARELVEMAKARGVQISLKEPLPHDDTAVELICRVDYSLAGQPRAATARARLSNRLDPSGIERLIFDPLRPEKVELFVGLPGEVTIDAQAQWQELPAMGSVLRLMPAGIAGAVALGAFAMQLPRISALLRPLFPA